MFYFFPRYFVTPITITGSTVAIAGALDDVIEFALDIFTNNVTVFVLFAMLGLGLGIYRWFVRKVTGAHRG